MKSNIGVGWSLVALVAVAALVAMAMAEAVGAAPQAGGGGTRYYQVAMGPVPIVTHPPYHNNEATLSFAIDRPGRVVAVHIAPTTKIHASMDDRVVGSLWVNASAGPTIDDLFCICADVPAMLLHRLAGVGWPATHDMPVQAGDVVTVLLGDEQSGAPAIPPATWVLEVEE